MIESMDFDLDAETAYLAGLWKADNCSTARGVVGIRSKDLALIQKFDRIMMRYFPPKTLRHREIEGYSKTLEGYVCSTRLARFLSSVHDSRESLPKNLAASFIAGFFDGDGSASGENSSLYCCYGLKDLEEALRDKAFFEQLGFEVSLLKSGKAWKNHVLKPRRFAEFILPFVTLERKRKELMVLISKRIWRAKRARSSSTVATPKAISAALCGDCLRK